MPELIARRDRRSGKAISIAGVGAFCLNQAASLLALWDADMKKLPADAIDESDRSVFIEFHLPHLAAGIGPPLDSVGSCFCFPFANRERFLGVTRPELERPVFGPNDVLLLFMRSV